MAKRSTDRVDSAVRCATAADGPTLAKCGACERSINYARLREFERLTRPIFVELERTSDSPGFVRECSSPASVDTWIYPGRSYNCQGAMRRWCWPMKLAPQVIAMACRRRLNTHPLLPVENAPP
jgi:hypothetical protein